MWWFCITFTEDNFVKSCFANWPNWPKGSIVNQHEALMNKLPGMMTPIGRRKFNTNAWCDVKLPTPMLQMKTSLLYSKMVQFLPSGKINNVPTAYEAGPVAWLELWYVGLLSAKFTALTVPIPGSENENNSFKSIKRKTE